VEKSPLRLYGPMVHTHLQEPDTGSYAERWVETLHIFKICINIRASRDCVAALVSGLQRERDWNLFININL